MVKKGDKCGTPVLTFGIWDNFVKSKRSTPVRTFNHKTLVKSKRSQLQMSFSMIFSIILIAVFLAVAIYAIYIFIGIGEQVKTGSFVSDLQNEIDNLWRESGGTDNLIFKRELGSKIKYVCFYDTSLDDSGTYENIGKEFKEFIGEDGQSHNFYFYPQKSASMSSVLIKHINLGDAVSENNPNCIGKKNGEFVIKLEKRFEALVRVSAG